MTKEEYRKHCEKQIERCILFNDAKHLKEHELSLGLLNENEKLIYQNKKYKEVIDKAIEYINGTYEMAVYTKSISLDEENIEDLLAILKEVK